jgi:hypothetical protein
MTKVAPLLSPVAAARRDDIPNWRLALDEIQPTGEELRPRLPLPEPARKAEHSAAGPASPRGARPSPPMMSGPPIPKLSADVTHGLAAVALDGLTASQNAAFLAELCNEMNLPTDYRNQLSHMLD